MPCRIYKLDFQEKNLNLDRDSNLKNSCMLKVESVWYVSFQEEHLSVDWSGNLDSSIGKSTRLVIWRSKVRIVVQVQIFLLKV